MGNAGASLLGRARPAGEGAPLLRTYRAIVYAAVVAGIVLFLYHPNRALLIIVSVALFSLLLWLVAMRAVPEPDRAVVYRLQMLHRIDGPGFIFVTPLLEHIEGLLDMRLRQLNIEVPQIRTGDGQPVRTNIEVTWRIHADLRGRLGPRTRAIVLVPDEQREKVVEEEAIHIARQVVSGYTMRDLGTAAAREAAMATMREGINEKLVSYGLQVDRVFWRGSAYPAKLLEAKLEGAVRLEHAQTLISMIEAFKQRLPEMQPEEIMALDAWLDTFSHGGGGLGHEAPPDAGAASREHKRMGE